MIDIVKVESELKRKEQKIAVSFFLGIFFLVIAIVANCFEKSIINTVIMVFMGTIGMFFLFYFLCLMLEIYENKYIKKIKLMYLEYFSFIKEEKRILFFIWLGVALILLGFIVYGFYIDNDFIFYIFSSLGIICLMYALFIFFKDSKKYNKELDKEIKDLEK
ncbi:MAG: hypothetical protein WC264_00285 [Candidatus Paceibacterota bacterium]|jgi:hypothetical protein